MSRIPAPVRGVLAILAGAAVFLASFLSPVADLAVRAVGQPAAGDQPEQSVRKLLYFNGAERIRDPQSYPKAMAGVPAGTTVLYVMGSSEFSASVDQNPDLFLPTHSSDFDFYSSGRAFTDTLVHTVELADVAPRIANHKVVLLVSPQWFVADNQVNIRSFHEAFSPQKWQSLIDNRRLPARTRNAILTAGGQLLRGTVWDSGAGDHGLARVAKTLSKPDALLARRAEVLRGESRAAQETAPFTLPYEVTPGSVPVRDIDWAAARDEAVAQNLQQQTNNPYSMDDGIWDQRYAHHLNQYRREFAHVDYSANAPEWTYLQLFLDVARESGIQVELVALPMNGRWYDFEGYPKARRARWYQRLAKVAAKNHVTLVDFKEDEYVDGFFIDGTHPGRLGWLAITQACIRFGLS